MTPKHMQREFFPLAAEFDAAAGFVVDQPGLGEGFDHRGRRTGRDFHRRRHVSAGGNDIVVDQADKGSYVLFLTSRGLKHYFTGFLRVPPGSDPKDFFEFDDKPPKQSIAYGKDWYYVAN